MARCAVQVQLDARSIAEERGRSWAEAEALRCSSAGEGWPRAWRAEYRRALPVVEDLASEPTALHLLAAAAYSAAVQRWDDLMLELADGSAFDESALRR